MDYTTHTVVNEYYDIDASSNKGTGEIYVLAFMAAGGSEYLVAGRYMTIMIVVMEIGEYLQDNISLIGAEQVMMPIMIQMDCLQP